MKRETNRIMWVVMAIALAGLVWYTGSHKVTSPTVAPEPAAAESGKEPLPEDIVAERMADTNYVAALKGLINERSSVIAEAKAVRAEMGIILSDAATHVDVSAEDAAQTGSNRVDRVTEPSPEPSADATVAKQETRPALGTNVAMKAGTVLSTGNRPAVARFDGVSPQLLAYVRTQPEWTALENRLNDLAAQQQDVQIRTETLIRERMNEQFDARMAAASEPVVRAPAAIIKTMTNEPDFNNREPIVITNVPAGGVKLPPRPDRKPISVDP